MSAERDHGWRGGELPEDFMRLPGVLALRVTVRPDEAGPAWCAGALAAPGVPPAALMSPRAAAAPARDTRALDALFCSGL